jgi:hypothetical protein
MTIAIPGARTNAGYAIGATYGTAVSAGAGRKLRAEITPSFNAELLEPRQIGSGASMIQTAERGNFKPTVGLSMDFGYRNCSDLIIAQMMGTSGAPVEQTASQGDWRHTITFNPTLNARYGTVAFETSTSTVMEFPSTACRSITISADDPPGIVQLDAELVANNAVLTGTVNTNASLAAATITDTELVAHDMSDTFRINAASGATLSGSDQFNITGFNLQLNRPQEILAEIRGAAGNSAPLETGLFDGTFTVNVAQLANHNWYTVWQNQTPQKATLNIQGTQIGTGVNRGLTIFLPRLILAQEPQYSVTAPGINAYTLTFRCIAATANPSGMSSLFPYFEIINTLSTSLLA